MAILDYAPWRPPLVIGIVGESGGGKTRSALELARGMVGPAGKITLIDTEMGRAGLERPHCEPWQHPKLVPPFSPGRYVEAIAEVQATQPDCIIIDSASHEWSGLGGCLEMVDAEAKKNEFAKWAHPTAQHKRFVNQLLVSPMPIILCLRAKEKLRQATNPATGKKEIVSDGLQPIQREGFVFELTISVLVQNGGFPVILKGNEAINHAFPPDRRVGRAAGEALAQWIEAMTAGTDPALDRLKRGAEAAAEKGGVALRDWFMGLSNDERARIKPTTDNLKSIAAEADRLAALAAIAEPEGAS